MTLRPKLKGPTRVVLLHFALMVCLLTIGPQFNCLGPVLVIYAIIFAFSFFVIRNSEADPIGVIRDFLSNYFRFVFPLFLIYVVLFLLNSVRSSAILDLLAGGVGLINVSVLMFLCPLSAGLAMYGFMHRRE